MTTQFKPDGTLSPQGFQIAAETLAERWKETNPNQPQWSWISPQPFPCPTSTKVGYLSLGNVYLFKENKGCCTSEGEISDNNGPDEDQLLHVYDFHIVYSFSYMVPVLYFHGYRYDGQPLNLKQIEQDLPLYSSMILKESKWTYITQEEHPYLHCPWYMLHPCGTSEWMKLLIDGAEAEDGKTKEYVISWLSVVGQAVGLRVPLEIKTTSSHAKSASSCSSDGNFCIAAD